MVDVEVGAEFFFDIGQVPQVATRLRWGHKFCEVSDLIQRRTPDKAQSTRGLLSVDLRETPQVAICGVPPAEALSSRRRWLRAR